MALQGAFEIVGPSNPVSAMNLLFATAAPPIKKPAHRPPPNKNLIRFRTAAVWAALCLRATGASPQDAWKWVATHLDREGLRPAKPGSQFKAKLIENWSTKGLCHEGLLKGMEALANAPLFASRDRRQVAEVAIITAVQFGKLAKLPNPNC
jgi:hypothetical protein